MRACFACRFYLALYSKDKILESLFLYSLTEFLQLSSIYNDKIAGNRCTLHKWIWRLSIKIGYILNRTPPIMTCMVGGDYS